MSNVASPGAANAPIVIQNKQVGWFGTLVLLVAIFIGTGYCIGKMHRPTPIKDAIAGVINVVKYVAMAFGAGFILGEPEDPGPVMMQAEGGCECTVNADGSATAKVDGKEVPALNHEFGG